MATKKTVSIFVEGKAARDTIKVLKRESEELSFAIERAKGRLQKMIGKEGSKEYIDTEKQIKNLTKEHDELNKVLNRGVKDVYDYQTVLNNLSTVEYSELFRVQRIARNELRGLTKDSEEYGKKIEEVRRINEAIEQTKEEWKGASEEAKNYKKNLAETLTQDVNSNSFSGNINEIKEGVKLLQDYRNSLDSSKPDALKNIDNAIEKLNQKLKESSIGFISVDEALQKSKEVGEGAFDGSISDLEKLKKTLVEYKQEASVSNPKGIKEIEEAINTVENKINETKFASIDLDDILQNLNKKSFEQLSLAAEKLQLEVKQAEQDTEKFAKKSAELRQVNNQLEEIKDNWKETGNATGIAANKVLAYIAAFVGIDQLTDKLKEMFNANLQLSDSLSAIQKTTGLSAKEVGALSYELDKIDTRASQEQIHQLAAAAGQMGITGQNEILGFVRASNILTVALDELGNEGVQSLVKINSLTGEAQRLGIEKALLATGSAINELSASSAATAGPIADIISRLGGVGAQARLTTAEMAALGATADALGQSAEVTGTSLTKFIGTLVSKTSQVAKAVGLDETYLQGLIDQGNTMEAMVAVFEKMNSLGGLANLTPIMGDLGGNGARTAAIFATFAGNIEMLKDQLNTSRQAFSQATSATNEYNVVNENAAALVARIGNSIKEYFINSTFVSWIENVLRGIMQLPQWLEKNVFAINGVTASISALALSLAVAQAKAALFAKGIATWPALWAAIKTAVAVARAETVKLFAVIGKHPIMLIVTAAAAAAGAIYKMVSAETEAEKSQRKLNESISQYHAEASKEQRNLNDVYNALQKASIGTEHRRKLISLFNKQYGKYLDKMLTEKSTAEDLKKAYDKVNTSLKQQIALKLQNAATEDVYTEGISKQQAAMDAFRKSMEGKKSDSIIDLMVGDLSRLTEEYRSAGKSNLDALYDIQRIFAKQYGLTNATWTEESAEAMDDYIRSVYNTEYKAYQIRKRFAPLIGNASAYNQDDIIIDNEEDEYNNTNASEDLDKNPKKKAREQYRAAIAALEAYFNERETLIRENGMKEGKTQVQINQELERLETEKLNDEIQLRKLLLEEYYKESTFDPSKYKGVISETDYFKEKDMEYLAELREQLEKWGVAMEDGMKKQLTDRMVKLTEQALKLREKINKILLEDNFTEQVMKQYHDTLQELGLLFGVTESELTNVSEKEGEIRLAYMREWAMEAYNLNATQLKNEVEQYDAFYQWRIGRTGEDYEALLIQLRKFHDDMEEAERKAAERRKKIFDNSEQGLNLKKQSDLNVKKEEDNIDMWERFQGLDLASEDAVNKAQIGMYKAKIEASQAYINQIKAEMQAEKDKLDQLIGSTRKEVDLRKMSGQDATEQQEYLLSLLQQRESLIRQERLITFEEEQKIEEARQGMLEHFMSIEDGKLNEVKKYTDAILEFSGQMGEAAFGEVEDRKEAGKQLIKTLLTTLKDWIQIKTTEMIMEKMFAQQSVATTGQQTMQELSLTGSKTTADIMAGTASATAKEAGTKGLIGLAVGAVIGAALSALLGAAMGAINKSKSEVAAVSGAGGGKLATGMLTYAEGNYPVLGNDGQVYNAKYEGAGMKTGIYRGGAHFGIFSEKKPEAIIDGDTTQRLIMNHPDIWKAIVTLSNSGRLPSGYGMRTFATGNINELTRQAQNTDTNVLTDKQVQMESIIERNNQAFERNNQVLTRLSSILTAGIHAKVDMYGNNGMFESMQRADRFANRTKMKK